MKAKFLGLFLFCGSLLLASCGKEDVKLDNTTIAGSWNVTQALDKGTNQTTTYGAGEFVLVFTSGGAVTLSITGQGSLNGAYAILNEGSQVQFNLGNQLTYEVESFTGNSMVLENTEEKLTMSK